MEKIIEESVVIDKNVTIEDGVKIVGKSHIKSGAQILFGSVIIDSEIGQNCIIENSKIEKSFVGNNCKIGPFSNIRQGCVLDENVKIGSFVELKNAQVGSGTKIPHLSYVGDAQIGKNTNIGCGVVFANFNGVDKQKSTIGDNVFVGCNVNIIAPVCVADNSYICAGTTVTNDTAKGDFVIGRVRQENKKRV